MPELIILTSVDFHCIQGFKPGINGVAVRWTFVMWFIRNVVQT